MRIAALVAFCLALCACGTNPGSGGLDAATGGQDVAPAGQDVGPFAPDCGCASPQDASSLAGPDAEAAAPRDAAVDPGPDASGAAGEDAALPKLTETEPNDFKPSTQFNEVTLPFEMTGTLQLGANPDMDVLGAQLSPGGLWTWRLESPSGKVVPKLFIFEAANNMPYFVSFAAQGQVAEQEQFVLSSGLWHMVVADKRNPPDNNVTCGGSNVCYGGADFDWKLTVRSTPRTPTSVAFPSTVQGTLRHAFALDLYGFHATASTKIDIDLKAKRKSPPSNLESRMSLYNATTRLHVITNDGQANLATTDAHISAPDGLPADGDYVLIIENTSPAATDLSYQLDFKILP